LASNDAVKKCWPSGKRPRFMKKEDPRDETEIREIDASPLSKELKKRWSYFIRKVYETDALLCPKRDAHHQLH